MAEVEYHENPIGFNKEFRSHTGSVGKHIIRLTRETAVLARFSAPRPGKLGTGRTKINYATGALAASIITERRHYGRVNDVEGRVVALSPHALAVHEGTKRHIIRPRRHPRLIFFWAKKGKVVSLPKVKHPGTPENKFLLRSLKKIIR